MFNPIDHTALLCFCDCSMHQVVQGPVVLEVPSLAVGIVSDNNRHVDCGLASMGLVLMLGVMAGNVDDLLMWQQVSKYSIFIFDPDDVSEYSGHEWMGDELTTQPSHA